MIQYGSNSHCLPGWKNLNMPEGDITKSLPWGDSSVYAFYLEHVIEHITGAQAFTFFEEAFRCLEPGGILRMAFPSIMKLSISDTERYANFLKKANMADGSYRGVIRHICCNSGHKSVWSIDTLSVMLQCIGFIAKQEKVGWSKFPFLCNIENHWRYCGTENNEVQTEVIEAIKPVILNQYKLSCPND